MLSTIISIVQITSAVLLVAAILLQSKGTGLGTAFGGGGTIRHTKRGAEKTIFIITIVLAVIFIATALANLLVS
ncbi:MAG: hypothetical protein ACD_76C00020G0003 [uncultured bacterium]|nr:MAG: hypothetical protein ACD_76C00020G0003 [uncultured bacterium]HBD05131.1 preprotein translocase subunit SecG [Candidatus Uhrbacteria bacterium]